MVFLLVPGIVFAYRNIKDRNMFWSLLAMTCFVYIFFSIAATKMPSFTLINGLTIFLLGATTIVGVLQLVKHAKTRTLLLALVAIGLFFLRIDLEQLQEKHTVWRDTNHYTRQLASNRRVFKKLQLNENTLIFNVPGRHFVEAMFYTDCMAYDFVPSAKAIKRLKKMGKSIAVFETPNSMLPHYILEDSNIEIIDAQLFVVG
jgi:4-amino-4-deoxy-L-arabinose transferase